MKRFLLLITACLAVINLAFAESLISGKVMNAADSEPVIGASVVVDGSTVGTITDMDGRFVISVPDGDYLKISYLGMKTQTVKAKNNLSVYLEEDAKAIEEIVVTGYGTSTRAQFVGSAKAVSSEDITSQATSNVTNALQGRVAGVQVVTGSGQPGTGAEIRVRGIGSINGGSKPLYVVDGAPVDEDKISLLNSYDIESMTILKDAASTSIYGARGANGVVLITTKNGSKDAKMTVSVDAKWGTNQRGVKNYNVIDNPGQYYELAYRALYNSQAYNGASAAAAYAYADKTFFTQSGVGYQVYTVPDGERVIGYNFQLNPHATLGYKNGDYYYTPDNWEKETLKENNLRHEYNINFQGGNNATQYYISLGYLNDPGLVNGSSFERFSGRVKVDSQVKKWLKVGANASYAHSTSRNPGYNDSNSWGSSGNVFYAANGMAPYIPFYVRNADGSIKTDANGYQIYDTGTSTDYIRPGGAPQGNHAINLLIDNNQEVTDYINAMAYLTLTPVEGLSITARLTPEYAGSYANELSNPFYGSVTSGGAVYVGASRFFSLNQQYLANYKKRFLDVHQIEAQVGWEMYTLKQQEVGVSNDHMFNPYIAEISNTYGVSPTSANTSSYTESYTTAGLLASVKYDLMDRYFLNATFRYDASSRFSPKNRWGAFGSVGAAWLITKESWMQDVDWVSDLKLKASWGTNGNDQLGNYYVWRNLYKITYNSETGEFSKVLSQIGNEELKWESQQMANVGLEFGFWDDRLSGSIDYYNRQNRDMLFYVTNPPSSGLGTLSTPMNIGKVTNQGLELDLNMVLFENQNVSWSVFGNLAYNRSKINELPDAYLKEDGKRWYVGSTYIMKEGGTLEQAYMREYAGVDHETGKAMYWLDPANHDLGTTTTYSEALEGDLGDVSAKIFGGFGTSLQCYGLDVNVQFTYQAGGKAYDGGYQQTMHAGDQLGYAWNKDILNAWTPENKDATVPRICASDTYNQETCDRWLVSSNYVSLNNVTVGYTVPQKWTRKLHMSKVRLFFQGDGLALWSARQGFDPRQSQNNQGVGLGMSTDSGNFVYSSVRTLSGGLNISF